MYLMLLNSTLKNGWNGQLCYVYFIVTIIKEYTFQNFAKEPDILEAIT